MTAVRIPAPEEEEQLRDVVRTWQQCKRDVTSAKQRLKTFLLRNDIRYAGRASWSARSSAVVGSASAAEPCAADRVPRACRCRERA